MGRRVLGGESRRGRWCATSCAFVASGKGPSTADPRVAPVRRRRLCCENVLFNKLILCHNHTHGLCWL